MAGAKYKRFRIVELLPVIAAKLRRRPWPHFGAGEMVRQSARCRPRFPRWLPTAIAEAGVLRRDLGFGDGRGKQALLVRRILPAGHHVAHVGVGAAHRRRHLVHLVHFVHFGRASGKQQHCRRYI